MNELFAVENQFLLLNYIYIYILEKKSFSLHMNELSGQHLDDTKLMILAALYAEGRLPACQASYESRYGAVASVLKYLTVSHSTE